MKPPPPHAIGADGADVINYTNRALGEEVGVQAYRSRLRLVTTDEPLPADYLPPPPPNAPRISTQNTEMMTAPKSAAMMRTPSMAKSKGSSK